MVVWILLLLGHPAHLTVTDVKLYRRIMASKNLGQVSGLWIGTSAPTNTTLIWYDSTPAIRCHKVYSVTAAAWVVLDQNVISAITYSELKNLAQSTGLTQGSWYKITNQGNILALAITSTKVQYVDVNNNFVIDDLAASATYIVTSSNLLIDDVSGVWDATNKRLKFSFAETAHDGNTDNDFIFGKKQRGGVWSLAKYKLSALISTVTGNSVTWNRGIFFNFNAALNSKTDVAGGVVGKNTYDSEKATMNQNITNVAASNQAILNTAKNYTDTKVAPSEIYSKTLPSAPTSGTAIDIAQGDTLSGIITKIYRWIAQFKVATGIKVSQSFAPTSTVQAINNNDTVDSALRKVQKSLNDISSSVSGEYAKVGTTPVQTLTTEPSAVTKDDTIKQAIQKLIYWITHIGNSNIKVRSIEENRMHLGTYPSDIFRVDIKSSDDLTGCGFGCCLNAGEDMGFFMYDSSHPNNPYRIQQSYMVVGSEDWPILAFCPVTQVISNTQNEYSVAATMPHYKGHLTESVWEGQPDYLIGMCLQTQIYLSQTKYDSLYNAGKRYVKIEVTTVDVYGSSRMPTTTVTYIEMHRVNIWGLNFSVDDLAGTNRHVIVGYNISFTATNS